MYYEERNRHQPVTVFIDEVEVTLPTRWAICSTCSGDGKHSLHHGAFSGQRLEEAQHDEDFWEDYISGQYDKVCDSCEGTGKVREVCEEKLTPEQKQALQEDRDFEDEQYAERRAEYMMSGEYLAEIRGY